MKVTRLKRGYRIMLTDSEYEALMDVATRGLGEIEALSPTEWFDLEKAVKRGLRTISGTGSWALEEDRRG